MPANLLTFLAVLLAGLTAVFLAFMARARLKLAAERETRMRSFLRDQSAAIRGMARQSLQLRRHIRAATDDIETLTRDFHATRERFKAAEAVDRRLYVLDDRRTPADQEFIASISHPTYQRHVSPKATQALAMAWMTGRRYVVWAVDKNRALDKINARLSRDQGYVISAIAHRDDEG